MKEKYENRKSYEGNRTYKCENLRDFARKESLTRLS